MTTNEPSLGPYPFSLTLDEFRTISGRALEAFPARFSAIANDPRPATLENTLLPLDELLLEVVNVSSHARILFNGHPEAALREAGRHAAEASDRLMNAVRLDPHLYARLRSIDAGPLDSEARFALEKLLRDMRRSGVELPLAERALVRALKDEIDQRVNEFASNIANLPGKVTFDSLRALEGLPEDYVQRHPPGPDGKVSLTTSYADVFPVMSSARLSETRRKVFERFLNRAYPENEPVLARILALRHEFAQGLGYRSYADYLVEDKMMESVANLQAFLASTQATLREPSREDLALLLERKRREVPGAPGLDAWDVGPGSSAGYYKTLLRKERFGVEASELREYLPYPLVRDGLFALVKTLFGIDFQPVPVTAWHPTVETYDAYRDGERLGRMYLDLVPRDGKYSHAAQFDVRNGIRGVQLPQAALICNFVEASVPKEEALLSHDDVVTFFHEFGHLLHALLAGHGRWVYNGQMFVEWDFVEVPSMLFEEWAKDPETLLSFARHFRTGAPLPRELAEKVRDADALGRGYLWMLQVGFARLSLAVYDHDPAGIDPTRVAREEFARTTTIELPEGTHLPYSFGHITEYAALYYTYIWSVAIARDVLSPFASKGTLRDAETAHRYAREILEAGATRPAKEMIERYLGRPWNPDAFRAWVQEGMVPDRKRPGVEPAPGSTTGPAGRPGSGPAG
ncbi:MAG: Zn-dependent oligopeptidase [Thermoplasmata archaeon]|nr:Zn-dependent oligopeptidase [Thermoplasmata archaeon]